MIYFENNSIKIVIAIHHLFQLHISEDTFFC